MASHLIRQTLRSSLLRPSPDLHFSALQSRARAFSSTSSRGFSLVDLALAGPIAVLDGIHAVGLPWYAVLPLSAVLVRTTVVHYFANRPGRRRAHTKALLQPVVGAKADIIARSKMSKEWTAFHESNGSTLLRGLNHLQLRWRAKNQAMSAIGKPFGIPLWSPRSTINLIMLVAFTEAIRLKSGCSQGLLPMILSPLQYLVDRLRAGGLPKPVLPEAKDPAQVVADRTASERAQMHGTAEDLDQTDFATCRSSENLSGQDFATEAAVTPSQEQLGMDATRDYFDPTLVHEGFAWFTDLTLHDSSMMLPAAVGLSMAASFVLRPTVGQRPLSAGKAPDIGSLPTGAHETTKLAETNMIKDSGDASGLHKRKKFGDTMSDSWSRLSLGQRFGVFFSGFFFFAALKMPVAILLYFIPSITIGWLQSRWLDTKYPIPQPIRKCTRPMMLRVRRQWREL